MSYGLKKLEHLFNDTLNEFQNNMNNLGPKYKNIQELLHIRDNDPHIQSLINAYALIHSSYKFENNVIGNRQINSILYNILDYKVTNDPIIILNIKSYEPYDQDNSIIIKENTKLINIYNQILITKGLHFINNIEITNKNIQTINGVHYLVVSVKSNDLKYINSITCYISQRLLKYIFWNEIYREEKDILIQLRPEYNIKGKITLNTDIQYDKYYKDILHKVTLCINIKPKIDTFNILIPIIENQEDLIIEKFNINHIYCINKCITTTHNINFIKDILEYNISMEDIIIRKLLKVHCFKDNSSIELQHSKNNINGWYLSFYNNNTYINFTTNMAYYDYFICEVEYINKEIYNNNFIFEEYIPLIPIIETIKYDLEQISYKNNNIIDIIYKRINLNIYNLIPYIRSLLDLIEYNNINIENYICEETVYIKVHNSIQIPTCGYNIKLNINLDNILLLLYIYNQVKNKINSYITIEFHTPFGVITYNNDYINIFRYIE